MTPTTTVVFAIDDAYCVPLQVALASLSATNADILPSLRVVILHENLGTDSRAAIAAAGVRHGINVELRPAILPDLPYNLAFGGTRANYLRLAIPAVITDADRVVYLDADIVVRDDLRGLFECDLGGWPLGAVRDAVNPTLASGRALPNWVSLGLDGAREYFNSGVLVFDLPACAADGLFDRAFAAVTDHAEHLRLWDQDALNLAADDRWHRLPRRLNTIPFSALSRTPWIRYRAEHVLPAAELVADENVAAIMHYVSPAKPWRGLLPHGPANEIYQHYLGALPRTGNQA